MSLKTRLYGLTILLHFILLTAAFWYLEDAKIEFLFVEIVLVTSLIVFILLIRQVLAPFQYVDLFSEILNEQEFTTRFSHTGNRELDNLMSMFNQMLNQLYEERLKLGDRKGMLQQLLDAIPLSIIVFDFDQTISQINPAAERLLGKSEGDVKGSKLTQLRNPIIASLTHFRDNESRLVSDGQGNRFRCQKNKFTDRGFERNFLVIQELTSELKSSEKTTYEKLIRLMSHEVNNTMAATTSMLRSCLNYASDINEEERGDYVEAMKLVIERTESLNLFMKDYAQIVRLPKPSLESCNLYHMLLSTQRLMQNEAEKKNIAINLPEFDSSATQISADKKQLEQVLINIIKNAIEATDNHGEINILITSNGAKLTLKIIDSGTGISEANKDFLFTPFFTTKSSGQGIGLMLVREILDAHHFRFNLYNKNSQGACFEINF